jgi:hypothetical protein
MIKGKTPEEIRKLFNIVNDFTPEEEVCFFHHLSYCQFTYDYLLSGANQEGKRELLPL